MKTKVAIVVPVFKAEKFLKEGLDSLLNQSLKDIKIICINDASPDNSKKILEDYSKKDNRIILINHEKNLGASKSRNDGIDYIFKQLPDTEYIAFFDADDKIEPNAYEKSYNEAKISGADILNFNFLPSTYWQYKTEATGDAEEYENNCLESIFDHKEFYTFVVCWSKIYKKELLEEIRFPEQKFYEDGGFSYKAFARAKKLRIIPDTMYVYNIENPDSTCSKLDELNRLKDIFKKMNDTIKDWKKLDIADKYLYQFIDHILLYSSLVCPNIIEGNYEKELNHNLGLNIREELELDNIANDTKVLIKKMLTKEN